MLKYASILTLVLAAGPALAQATQSPPSPNAGQAMPQSSNSLPAGAGNMSPAQSPHAAGAAVGTTGAAVGTAVPVGPGGAGTTTVPAPQSR